MRSLSPDVLAALAARRLVARDFLWLVARERESLADMPVGFWSGLGNVEAAVVHPDTGAADVRSFYGSGTLISVSEIPLVSTLEAQNVTIVMSQIDDLVEEAVRRYDCKQARVEIYRGLFSPETRLMVAPAEPRFIGFVDTIEITTPAENEAGSVTLTCASHTQEMTRFNPDVRSDASQRLRGATDNFFQDAATVGEWEHFWGQTRGTVATVSSNIGVGEMLMKALKSGGYIS